MLPGMYADYLASALATLLVTVDPVGLAPIFLTVTRGMTARERRGVAVRAALIAFCILAFFGLAGEVFLRLLGIGLPAFRIAGGLLLFWIAFEMVFERRADRNSTRPRSRSRRTTSATSPSSRSRFRCLPAPAPSRP